MKTLLTGRQQLLWQMLEWRLTEGRPPSHRELCRLLHIPPTSLQAVRCHLRALEKKGYIRIERAVAGKGRSRNIRLATQFVTTRRKYELG